MQTAQQRIINPISPGDITSFNVQIPGFPANTFISGWKVGKLYFGLHWNALFTSGLQFDFFEVSGTDTVDKIATILGVTVNTEYSSILTNTYQAQGWDSGGSAWVDSGLSGIAVKKVLAFLAN